MCHTDLLTACKQDQDGTGLVPSWSYSQAVSKPVWHTPMLCVQWKTPDDGQRNCPKHLEFNSKNKFEKLVHLVGFIIRNYHDVGSGRSILILLASWQQNLCHIPLLCVQWKTPDDGQRNCPKHLEFYSKNKLEKLVHLVGAIIRFYHDARSPERQFLSVGPYHAALHNFIVDQNL